MTNVIKAADAADMIINGYAFKKDGTNIKVLNLNKSGRASVIAWEFLTNAMPEKFRNS